MSGLHLNIVRPAPIFIPAQFYCRHQYLTSCCVTKNSRETIITYLSLLKQCKFGLCGFNGLICLPLFQEIFRN